MACSSDSRQGAAGKTSAATGQESTVSASMSGDDAAGESSGLVAGSGVIPLAAEIIAVAGVAGGGGVAVAGVVGAGVVAMVAGPQMAPHSVVVAAAVVVS